MQRDDELLTAVDALTKPITRTFLLKSHQHHWEECRCKDKECTKPLICNACDQEMAESTPEAHNQLLVGKEHPSLLEQLRLAVANSMGAGGGSGKSARERTPLDVGAFTLFETIDGRIRSWCQDIGVKPKKDLGESLTGWWDVWKLAVKDDALIDRHTAILDRWRIAIEDIVDPPARIEITRPCPNCGQMWATVGEGELTESKRACWAIYRESADDSYAICHACDRIWRGIAKIREMRSSMDTIEATVEVGDVFAWPSEGKSFIVFEVIHDPESGVEWAGIQIESPQNLIGEIHMVLVGDLVAAGEYRLLETHRQR